MVHLTAVLLLLLAGTIGLWLMDVAALVGADKQGVCNGYWCIASFRAFHIGLYLGLASIWGLALLVLGSRWS